MDYALINYGTVKENKAMKTAQKEAKKYYGKVRGEERKKLQGKPPKAKLNKVVDLSDMSYISLVEKNETVERGALKQELPEVLSPEMLIEQIRESGLTGLSGDGYLTADKLAAFAKSKSHKKYLVINGVECDPGLIHDAWIIENRFENVKVGVEVLRKVFNFESITLATKSPLPTQDTVIQKVQIPNRFPMGYEKYLIQTILGVEVGENEFPAEQGILVLNVQTVLKIGELICSGEKFQDRYLTIADLTQGKAVTVRATIGAEVKDIIGKVFPKTSGNDLFVGFGAMTVHKAEDAEQIMPYTNFIGYGKAPDYEAASNCKGCGACSAKCPQKIKVKKIVQAMECGQTEGLERFHPEKCIGCSTCTYMCHAGKDIAGIMKQVNGKA